ncbi:MAG: hypothetical protein H0W86_06680 [Armatimonadetes bacterium]|nr:hypothetical protein [Armatimonadota bacterium]
MAVIIQLEWPGLTLDQFDEARRRIRWEEEPAKGSIVQAQGWDNGTFKAADIWESEEDWNNFLQNRILPAVAGLNIPGQPTTRVFDAYGLLIPGLRKSTGT